MKQAFYLLHKQNIARAWQQESTFYKLLFRLVVKPACVNAALDLSKFDWVWAKLKSCIPKNIRYFAAMLIGKKHGAKNSFYDFVSTLIGWFLFLVTKTRHV